MALKNDPCISELGKRLLDLIEEKDATVEREEDRIKSPAGLAKQLYTLGYVHVNTGNNLDGEGKDRSNACGSIEKTIRAHIKNGKIVDQKGEMLLAYCKFFIK